MEKGVKIRRSGVIGGVLATTSVLRGSPVPRNEAWGCALNELDTMHRAPSRWLACWERLIIEYLGELLLE